MILGFGGSLGVYPKTPRAGNLYYIAFERKLVKGFKSIQFQQYIRISIAYGQAMGAKLTIVRWNRGLMNFAPS